MGGRGPQSFKKRQKEQQRKEKQQEKVAKRLVRKQPGADGAEIEDDGQTEEYGPVVIEGDDFPGSLIKRPADTQ
jgi:hypothetical protein